jgi:hypothetical protein
MKKILFAILFVFVCLAAILTGFYAYIGTTGTLGGREDSVAREKFLSDPAFSYKHQFLTKEDLEGVPENIAEQYRDSVRVGYVLAVQGDMEKVIIFFQSFLLLVAGVAGLLALKRPAFDA